MRKPFIMTHIAILVLALCSIINLSRLLKHMCCEGGPYYFDIMWYLGFIVFFAFMMTVFDIIQITKQKKETKDGDSKKKS